MSEKGTKLTKYKCIENFEVEMVDDNYDEIEGETFKVFKESMWEEQSNHYLDEEVTLMRDDSSEFFIQYLGISKEMLKKYFIEVKEENV